MKTTKHFLAPLAVLACAVMAPTHAEAQEAGKALQKEVISTTNAPAAVGPYSQAIKAGNMLFLAGQIPLDPKTSTVVTGGIDIQTSRVLDNLKAVLAANGMTMNDMVSTTVYLKDMNEFAKMNAVYAQYFGDKAPARATVEVARLPKDVLVEISGVAVR